MDVYIYQADIYCADDGDLIAEELKRTGRGDPSTGDSDDWPQGPYGDGGGESDTPQHCGAGEGCVNAVEVGVLPESGKPWLVGAFLNNPLTRDGVAYVVASIKESPDNPVTAYWARAYCGPRGRYDYEEICEAWEKVKEGRGSMEGLGGDRPSKYRLRRIKQCATCGHHVSAHRYDPTRPRSGPGRCTIPGCSCAAFVRPGPGQRIPRGAMGGLGGDRYGPIPGHVLDSLYEAAVERGVASPNDLGFLRRVCDSAYYRPAPWGSGPGEPTLREKHKFREDLILRLPRAHR